MLKVLLVDDEEVICQMLCKLINWEARGMEIIGMAGNGIEAVKMMESMLPDIVISDVRMPGMDGLQLVEKGKELGLAADYIIMSGYKHFEYAYTALNLGVIYYLLKPINQNELEETLDRIIKSRQEKDAKEQEHKKLEQIAKDGSERIRKHFLNDIIQTNGILTPEKEALEIDYEFSNDCFLAFLTKIDQNLEDRDTTGLLDVVDYTIEKIMAKGEWEYINSYVKRGVVTIVNYESSNRAKVEQAIEEIMAGCRREMDKFQGFYIVIGVGGEKYSLADTQISIREAVEAVKARIKLGTDRIIRNQDLDFNAIDSAVILNQDEQRVFEKEINSLDQAAFITHTDKVFQQVTAVTNYSPASLFELMDLIKEFCLHQLRKNYISEELLAEFEETMQSLYDCNYKEGMLKYRYQEACRHLFVKVTAEKQNRSQKPIRGAEQYIHDHFNEPITLEEVAEAINLSSAYLSTLFKKEKGIRFSDYLTAYRMEQAKQILKDTNDTIQMVAEAVGYVDAKYFSKTFSKSVGLKPTEYRRLYS